MSGRNSAALLALFLALGQCRAQVGEVERVRILGLTESSEAPDADFMIYLDEAASSRGVWFGSERISTWTGLTGLDEPSPRDDLLLLDNGDLVRGRLVAVEAGQISLEHALLGRLRLGLDAITGLRLRDRGQVVGHEVQTVVLRRGGSIYCTVGELGPQQLLLHESGFGALRIPRSEVEMIRWSTGPVPAGAIERDMVFLAKGDRLSCQLLSFSAGSAHFRTKWAEAPFEIPVGDIASIAFTGTVTAVDLAHPRLVLRDGTELAGALVSADTAQFQWRTLWSEELSVEARSVDGVRFETKRITAPQASIAPRVGPTFVARPDIEVVELHELRNEPQRIRVMTQAVVRRPGPGKGDADRIWLDDGDLVSGQMVSADSGHVIFRTDYGELRIERRRVTALTLASPDATPAYLGVSLRNSGAGGLSISRVVELSPAAQAGLLLDDVVLEFDGVSVGDFQELSTLLDGKNPGDVVDVLIVRQGNELRYEVVLGERRP